MIGQVIGNYRIVSELGRGGMGMVYRAEHVQLGRPAALKMLQPQLSSDASIVQRFFNEARAASSIDHPGIVEIYDFGTHVDGRAYIVMALLKGESLSTRLERGPMAPLEAATLIVQVVSALVAAHARGIVHRDLKPDNIYLVPNEMMPNGIQAKLLDFGIAKLADDPAGGFKTQTGVMIGTPAYMSPEQCMGRADLDHRTDLYSIGCILFHALCGRPPFLGEQGTGMMIASHLRDIPPDVRSLVPAVPAALAQIVARLLEKEPAARFQSAAELKQALISAGAHGTMSRPPEEARGPMSYAATMAPTQQTTQGGSAAELVAQPAKKSGAAVWVGVGLLLAGLIGVGVFALMRRDAEPLVRGSAASPPPPPQTAKRDEPPPAPKPAATPAPAPAAVPAPASTPAPPAPAPSPAAVDAGVQHLTRPPLPIAETPTAKPTLHLDALTYAPSAPIMITFGAPLSSKPNHKAWVTVVEAGKPATQYGTWDYIADGARSAKLKAPAAPGAYEVRLHTDYPAKSTNVVASVALTVNDATAPAVTETPRSEQHFTLASTTLQLNEPATVKFAVPLRPAKGERFWITVVAAGSPDSTWGKYDYVTDGAKQMTLAIPATAGDYEIRLHANYPRLSTNVVHRESLRVVP